MELSKLGEEFLQWQKDRGKMKYELTDIAINDNGNYRFEKRMAWVSHNTPDDWKEFCKATGKNEKDMNNYILLTYCENKCIIKIVGLIMVGGF